MKRYDFDTAADRRGTFSMKTDLMDRLYPGCDENTIPMWVADMDFRCSDAVINALHERVDRGVFGYTTLEKADGYYECLSEWFRQRYGYEINRDDVYYCPGIVPAISIAINAFTKPGDGVLINRPVYPPFISMASDRGRRLVNEPLRQDESGKWVIDTDSLEKRIVRENVKLYVFCSPHNPVGKVWSEEELRRIGEICRKHGVTVFSDEIHCDITRNGVTHTVMDSLFEDDDFIITGTAPSKTFNIPGIPLSNIIVRGSRKKAWERELKSLHISTPGVFTPDLLEACYRNSRKWHDELLDYLDANFRLMKEYIDERIGKVKFEIPNGTYLGWMDFKALGKDNDTLSEMFIKGGFALQDGRQFGSEGNGFFRINAATSRSNIRKMLESLERIAAGCMNEKEPL